jgi:hypothetical protein
VILFYSGAIHALVSQSLLPFVLRFVCVSWRDKSILGVDLNFGHNSRLRDCARALSPVWRGFTQVLRFQSQISYSGHR